MGPTQRDRSMRGDCQRPQAGSSLNLCLEAFAHVNDVEMAGARSSSPIYFLDESYGLKS